MGANASKSVANISNTIDNELAQQGFSSTTCSANIIVGNITIKNAKRSQIINSNRCSATAQAALDAATNAATDEVMKLNTKQRTSVIPGVNISDTRSDIRGKIKQKLEQICMSNANTALLISTKDLIIEGGEDNVIRNVNTGTAEGNCAVRTVMDAALTSKVDASTDQFTGDIFSELFSGNTPLFSGASSVLLCSCIMCIVIFYILRKPR